MRATYTHLKDSSWGIRIEGDKPKSGSAIRVQKRSGEYKLETVGKFVKSYPDCEGKGEVHIFTIESQKRSGCGCDDSCCKPRCYCDRSCNCKGGNIYDC